MGFGTIFSTLTFLLIFAGMIVLVVNIQKTVAESTTEIKAQQERLAEQTSADIDILSTSYTTNDLQSWSVTYKDEFDQGTFVNTTTQSDSVEVNNTFDQGTYTSIAYDTGYTSNYTSLSWSSVSTGGASVQFQVRSAASQAALTSATFIGPDGTTNDFYTVSGTPLNETHDGDRYLQYRAYFSGATGETLELQSTSIGVRRITGQIFVQVENTGDTKIKFEETDVYVDGQRVMRQEANRMLEKQIISDERLWNPGEELNITVYQVLGTSATITVANGLAQDQAVVTP